MIRSDVVRRLAAAPLAGLARRPAASALAAVAAAGLIATFAPAVTFAQRADAPTVQTPYGRAPISFADIVDRVKPAVVSIHVTNAAPKVATAKGQRRGLPDGFPDLPDDHPLNEFFKNLPKEFKGNPPARPMLAQGSGFVISPDGFVVTNNHVVDGASKIEIRFDEHNKHEAELVGADSRTDLALLKIKDAKGATFPFVKLTEKAPRVGDWVLAVGNPFGLGGTVTAGIVSANGRDIGSGPYDYMQIDAAVNRGNSGGPTFNLDGDVVGINTAIYSPSGGNVGIAFAVPARVAKDVIDQLKSSGSVSRGWLGVKIQNIDEDTAASLGLPEPQGALVNEVTAGGPAAAAGMKNGDAILSVNGQKIADSRDLARKIANFSPDTAVDVRVLRGLKEQNISVKLGNFPAGKELAKLEQDKPAKATEMNDLGLTLSKAPGETTGVVITEIDSDSDAATKGLKQGDIILDAFGLPVNTPADVDVAIKQAQKLGRPSVLLRVKSGDQTRMVPVNFTKKG
ncbi:MAG: Do family serine endopeptidase [Hyphomicrobiaceae bacterium]|jgi:serine protease Do